MKFNSSLLFFLILFRAFSGNAQDLNSKTILTVDGQKTEAGEFIRMYQKSIDQDIKISLDEYMQQFIVFKLKVADAIKSGYDTNESFRSELNGYRNQLALNYLNDNTVKEKLLKQAYQRSLSEINAWHILIGLPFDPSGSDTLKAWNKAMDIRKRIVEGEPFEQVARSASDDKSVLSNGGNLGYFSVFQMITPFENAAYSLKKGEISKPIRTPYGYHIIMVTDIRPSKGKVRVAHIMKNVPPGSDESVRKKAENEINLIYDKLKSGTSFSNLAYEYSDHRQSAVKGGQMDWFGTGEIIAEFSEAAFSLKDTGDYTRPIKSPYGYHIIKLLEKKPVQPYNEIKPFLESRINESYLNSISRKSFIEKLKKDYGFTVNMESYDWFILNTDTLIIQGLKKYDRTSIPRGIIYSFRDQQVSNNEFAGYIEKRGFIINTSDSVLFINTTIETMSSDHLLRYENASLEKKNPEFRYLMNEFHDGILMFEISADKVWNPVSEDTSGLLKYYEENKTRHLSEPGIEAKIYTLRKAGGQNALTSAYKRYARKPELNNLLLKKFNKNNDTLLVIIEGKWLKGQDKTIDNLQWIKGEQVCTINGFPSIVIINKLIDPVPLPFEQVQEEMVNGFQEYLENSWIKQLKEKYLVKIDDSVFNEVKKKLGNE